MSLKEKLKKSIVDTLGEDYQASVVKGHEKAKKELIGLGDEDTAAGGGPYKEKASMKRSKSAPPAAAPMASPLEEAEPAKGTGKKPKGSTRRLYTDENPSDTVPIKFKTVDDVQDTLSRSDYKAKSHARKSQIIQVIKQRACVAAKNAKKPETKARLNKVCKYATKRAEAHKKKTNETVLQEALSDRLYHYTYVGTILDILEKDHFLPSVAFERPSEEEIGKNYKYFISFARNLRGSYHKEGRGAGYFVVNGKKLSQNYKGSAIDYWERAKFDPKATKETEAEDRLYTNKPYVKDAAKYIEAVHISAPYETKFSSGRVQEEKYSEGLVDKMKKIAEIGKSKGIPVYYHTDLGSYRMANAKKALDFAQWAKGAADAGIIEPAVVRSYTPGPPDLMRLETAVNAIEKILIKGTSYKDFLDTLSSEELHYVRRRLFYSFSGNDIASRIRDELNIYKTKPEARPFIARLGRAMTKLKMNLAEIGIKLGDLVEKEVRGLNEDVTVKVLGYVKPDSAFHTLDGWENFVNRVLQLQKQGASVRGGEIKGSDELVELINSFFSFQLDTEVERYELLTRKNVIDFIEDFVNHRFWGLKREFGSYFPDIDKLRFAYFYSRGDLEPYVLIDDEFTKQFYGGLDNPLELKHYTSVNGIERIQKAIDKGDAFDISAFTVMTQPFFRATSNKIITFKGNVRAAFRSDVKSFATSTGRKAVNLYRLEYPGEEENICPDLETLCADDTDTSLWNEIIATPMEILKVEDVPVELNEYPGDEDINPNEPYGDDLFVAGDGETDLERFQWSQKTVAKLKSFIKNTSTRNKTELHDKLKQIQAMADEGTLGSYYDELKPPAGKVYRGIFVPAKTAMSWGLLDPNNLPEEGKLQKKDNFVFKGSWYPSGLTSWSYDPSVASSFVDLYSDESEDGEKYVSIVLAADAADVGFILNHKNVKMLDDAGEKEVLFIGDELGTTAYYKYYDGGDDRYDASEIKASELNEDEEARASFAKGLEKVSLKDPDADSSKYQRVPRRSTKKDYAKAGRLIKQLYAKLADRAFLNSLKTVHWGGRAEMINIIKNYQNLKRDELSASAYLPSEDVYKVGPFGMDFGVLIKGYVTLLANNMDDISSGSGKAYKEELPPERTASSGANKGVGRVRYPGDYEKFKIFVFDKEDYDPEKDWAGGPRNEALVDNWKIEAVIIPDDADAEKNKKNFAKYLEKMGINAKVVTHKEL